MQLSFGFDRASATPVAHGTPAFPASRQTRSLHPRRKRRRFGRYAQRRRPSPLPKSFTGYGAYRLVMARNLAHVIGPAGKRCEELTAWARSLLEPPPPPPDFPGARRPPRGHDPFAETRRVVAAADGIRMLLDAINWVHPARPDVVADLLDRKPAKARDVVAYYLRLRGCVIGKGRGRNGGRIVTPGSGEEQWGVGVTLSRFRQLFDFWADEGIRDGHNPMQMDPDRSRMREGQARKVKHSERRWWLDVDGFFRTRHVDRQAPRPGDQDVARKVLELGREVGWPEEVSLLYEGMYLAGARFGQLAAATAYGLLVDAKDDRHLALVQKGSGGALAWQARTPPVWRARVLALLARNARRSVAELTRMAKSGNDVDHAVLRKLYIFSPDGCEPIPHWRAAHLLRLVVERLDLRYTLRSVDGAAVVRWFTAHWFRHMFVNRMLDRISEKSADQATRDRARDRLAAYMGWRHPAAMIAYYGAYHLDQETNLLVAEHQDDLNAAALNAFGDDFVRGAANDNGLLPKGRLVGGDLLD